MARLERQPSEVETLHLPSAEAADAFAERVEGRQLQEMHDGMRRDKEVLAQEVAAEFAAHGEGVDNLAIPWEHSEAEHTEAQALVNVAFEDDLGAALKRAQGSESYPRNVDLFHDVLVSQLYEVLNQRGVNKQPLPRWPLVVAGVAGLAIIVLLVIALL